MSTGTPKSAALHPGPGFRITHDVKRSEDEVMRELGRFATPEIADLLNRLYTMSPAIRPMTDPHLRLVGPACTVKVFPGDNLMVHKALDVAAPGDVVVVDTSASVMTAVLGDLICTKARHRGIAGFVVDGLIRDVERIRELAGFPVFARGVTPTGPLHRGPGELNYPVSAGGVVVHPGDVVVGDLNGVVVVPREVTAELVERLCAGEATQADYARAVAEGRFSNGWVDEALARGGLPAGAPAVAA